MKMFKEFRDFAVRGNMIDLAVGIIIGAAFGKIIASLVSDLIMPPIGLLLGGMNFTDIKVIMREASVDKAAVTLNIGNFIQTLVDFLIIAFSIFLIVKAIMKFQRKKQEATPTVPVATKEQELLGEIRDILRTK